MEQYQDSCTWNGTRELERYLETALDRVRGKCKAVSCKQNFEHRDRARNVEVLRCNPKQKVVTHGNTDYIYIYALI